MLFEFYIHSSNTRYTMYNMYRLPFVSGSINNKPFHPKITFIQLLYNHVLYFNMQPLTSAKKEKKKKTDDDDSTHSKIMFSIKIQYTIPLNNIFIIIIFFVLCGKMKERKGMKPKYK